MRSNILLIGAAAACLTCVSASDSKAAEAGFSTYALGSNAFGAGATPPPGTYLTAVVGYYQADIGASIPFHRVVLNAGAEVKFFSTALNALYVPETKVFGGNLGLSLTVPVGHVDIEANIGLGPLSASRQVDGWGLGDIIPKVQLGWNSGAFSHTVWIQAVAPTGRYDPTFAPNIGLNRPGIDTGVAVTYTDKATGLQFNGATGITFNFENDETDYKSGTEFHFDWAIGREIARGLVIGVVGYDYRQITGDSGSGATLGPFKGRVDAIGPGLAYTTLIGTTPFIFNLRHYHEYNAKRRWEGNQTMASGTIRF